VFPATLWPKTTGVAVDLVNGFLFATHACGGVKAPRGESQKATQTIMTNTLVFRYSLVAALTMLAWSPVARAQSPPAAPANTQSAAFTAFEDPRPVTTTFLGDTGIWYVPTAEVLRGGTWSLGGDRRGTNYVQGLSNVADFAGNAAVGIGNRVEVFGAFMFDTRVNRNDAPVFVNENRQGGIVARYPRVNESWTGNNVGDLYLGTKVNVLSEYREAPLALAVRGIVKVPTGDDDVGVSTGKTDVMADVIVSKEIARFFEAATYVGYEVRGHSSGFDGPNGSYRWGTGVAFPSRRPLRFSAEANGDLPTSYRATLTDRSIVGDDASLPPLESSIRNRTRATGGLTYQMPAGFFMGTGLSWNAPRYWDWQVRIGYHGRDRNQSRSFASVTRTLPAAAPVAQPTPLSTPFAETPRAAVVSAPPSPAIAPPPAAASTPVPQAAAPGTYSFEDVYFDLDGFTPRAETLFILDNAARAMLADPTLNLNIEGHTCNIGTAEYNLALAERRANAVRDYLLTRGVSASRLRTASFGEEDPEHANAHEETRRLNRRVALIVRLEP
jgi:outer membrane protein OmpA-like peptidoglycan-associated protein